MCAAISVADDVSVTLDFLRVGVPPKESYIYFDDFPIRILSLTLKSYHIPMEAHSPLADNLDELCNPALILVGDRLATIPLVGKDDFQAAVEEGGFLQSLIQGLVIEVLDVGEEG